MKWIIIVIALWILLAVDFIVSFNEITHIAIHAVAGIIGTFYIYKNRSKLD